MHLISLHVDGSNCPEGIKSSSDKLRFHPYFTSKDLIGFLWLFILISLFIYYSPNYLGHPDNSIPANPLVTPASIVPEWYFLPFYAILRAIPNKIGGVLGMFGALLILHTFPRDSRKHAARTRLAAQLMFWACPSQPS